MHVLRSYFGITFGIESLHDTHYNVNIKDSNVQQLLHAQYNRVHSVLSLREEMEVNMNLHKMRWKNK